MTTYVVVPVKDEPALACNVVARATQAKEVCVWVYDNGSTRETRVALEEFESDKCGIHDAAGMGLYEMWDDAWSTAQTQSGDNLYEIAFLNSDIDFLPGTLERMRTSLRACGVGAVSPDYSRTVAEGESLAKDMSVRKVRGSYRHGGLAGWCFMVRGELRDKGVKIDTQFEWWAGDDDLFFQVEESGLGLGIVTGLPLDHVGEATARNHAWTQEAKSRDMERLREKWGARGA